MSDLTEGPLRILSRGYQRRPDVTDEIRRFVRLSAPDRRTHVRGLVDGGADWPPHECIVYVIRHLMMRGDEEMAWRTVEALMARVRSTILWNVNRFYGLSRTVREDVYEDVALQLYEAWLSLAPEHEFWEVQFGLCLRKRVIDAVRKTIREAKLVVDTGCDEEGKDQDGLAELPDTISVRPDELAMALVMLEGLPTDLQLTIHLRFYEGLSEVEIAQKMGVTDRTVRNRLARALVRLKDERYRMDEHD